MFKNEFQGGPFVEVFSSQGKDPLVKWKLTGASSTFKKIYDKEIKSYCHVVEGSTASTKMRLPKDNRQALVLIQRFFVIQLCVSLGQDFSIELGICDLANNKRRIVFSTSHKEISITPLHAKIPLAIIKRAKWLNLCLDMVSFVGEAFKGQTFKSLDFITISATCKLRKIFTLKMQPLDNTDDDELYQCTPLTNDTDVDYIPAQCQFHKDVLFQTQVINMIKLRHADYKTRGDPSSRPTSSSGPAKDKGATHIAFGSRVRIPSSPSSRTPTSAGRREGTHSGGPYSNRTPHTHRAEESPRVISSKGRVDTLTLNAEKHIRLKADPGKPLQNERITVDKESLSGSKTWSGGGDNQTEIEIRKPHPPKDRTGGVDNRTETETEIHKPHPPQERSKEPTHARRVVKVCASSGNRSSNASSRKNSEDVATRAVYDKNKYSDNKDRKRNRNESESSVDTDEDVRKLLNSARELLSNTEAIRTPRTNMQTDSFSESDDMFGLSDGSVFLQDRNKMSSKARNFEIKSFQESNENNGTEINKSQNKVDITDERTIEQSQDDKFEEDFENSNSSENNGACERKLYTFNSKPRQIPANKKSGIQHEETPEEMSSNGLKIQFKKPKDDGLFGYKSDEEDNCYHVVIKEAPVENKTSIFDVHIDAIESANNCQSLPQKSESPRVRRKALPSGHIKRNRSPKQSKDSQASSSRMNLKRLKELAKDDPRLSSEGKLLDTTIASSSSEKKMENSQSKSPVHKVTESTSPTANESRLSDDYDWRNNQSINSSSASSVEARVLQSLQRQQLEEDLDEGSSGHFPNNFQDIIADFSDSSDDSTDTWQRPGPPRKPYDIMNDAHMESTDNLLIQTNPQKWSGLRSPPVIPTSERLREGQLVAAQLSLSNNVSKGGKSNNESDEELDLLYDPCLNCYFDPVTHKYYELA